MKGVRSHRLLIGLLMCGLSCVILGAVALGGFSSASSGDLAVSSTGWATNLMLALGAILLLVLEFAHARSRRPRQAEETAPARKTARAWLP
jgi:arginine exporter protein ArgO